METNFKNLKTEKEKIDFLKEKIKEYFIPFERGGYILKDKWGKCGFGWFCSWEGFFAKFGILENEFEKLKADPVLFDYISFANNIIKDTIIKGGLSGGYNPKFTVVATQNMPQLKWTTKTETKDAGRKTSVIINILNERKRRKLPTIMDTTAKKLTKQARLTKLDKKSSLHSERMSEDVPVELDKLKDS